MSTIVVLQRAPFLLLNPVILVFPTGLQGFYQQLPHKAVFFLDNNFLVILLTAISSILNPLGQSSSLMTRSWVLLDCFAYTPRHVTTSQYLILPCFMLPKFIQKHLDIKTLSEIFRHNQIYETSQANNISSEFMQELVQFLVPFFT